ncbi:hypothetical protein C8J57DRAFT_1464126 [Mycena rebaudengoi]|nr:hypothetical protein C8J57DRAFT_1471072 [Mycena rebaudengoi]KAJ7280627.1 hypothetical protein C8J57DRAFT_1464126 [Mycena rebaudengoi]
MPDGGGSCVGMNEYDTNAASGTGGGAGAQVGVENERSATTIHVAGDGEGKQMKLIQGTLKGARKTCAERCGVEGEASRGWAVYFVVPYIIRLDMTAATFDGQRPSTPSPSLSIYTPTPRAPPTWTCTWHAHGTSADGRHWYGAWTPRGRLGSFRSAGASPRLDRRGPSPTTRVTPAYQRRRRQQRRLADRRAYARTRTAHGQGGLVRERGRVAASGSPGAIIYYGDTGTSALTQIVATQTRATTAPMPVPAPRRPARSRRRRRVHGLGVTGAGFFSFGLQPQPQSSLVWQRITRAPAAARVRASIPASASQFFYQLYHAPKTVHRYTIQNVDVTDSIAISGYDFTGVVALSVPTAEPSTVPFFASSTDHFPAEWDAARTTRGFSDFDTAGYICPSQVCGSIPLYRLHFVAANSDCIYTTSTAERDDAMNNKGLTYEGIAGYVFTLESAGYIYSSQVCGSVPFYLLHFVAANSDYIYTDVDGREG